MSEVLKIPEGVELSLEVNMNKHHHKGSVMLCDSCHKYVCELCGYRAHYDTTDGKVVATNHICFGCWYQSDN